MSAVCLAVFVAASAVAAAVYCLLGSSLFGSIQYNEFVSFTIYELKLIVVVVSSRFIDLFHTSIFLHVGVWWRRGLRLEQHNCYSVFVLHDFGSDFFSSSFFTFVNFFAFIHFSDLFLHINFPLGTACQFGVPFYPVCRVRCLQLLSVFLGGQHFLPLRPTLLPSRLARSTIECISRLIARDFCCY